MWYTNYSLYAVQYGKETFLSTYLNEKKARIICNRMNKTERKGRRRQHLGFIIKVSSKWV